MSKELEWLSVEARQLHPATAEIEKGQVYSGDAQPWASPDLSSLKGNNLNLPAVVPCKI